MSFSFEMLDKEGRSLLDKYKIHSQLLGGIAGNDSRYDLSYLRQLIANATYAKEYPKAAQDVWRHLSECVAQNKKAILIVEHPECPECDCISPIPGWVNISEMDKILSVPIEEVHSLWGGW